ncbi:hypothetical protein [Bacillus sp. cl95]|uniref:hypothetical protein n=1 Tax=Bacillus sp. cl95 TaxID=1761761 RepID=UPI000B872238|nr:hypothetical protein [Bacillus sp. cl95]
MIYIELDFLELLAIFTVFYIIRFFVDSNYKNKGMKKIVFDVIVTSILAFVLKWIIGFYYT